MFIEKILLSSGSRYILSSASLDDLLSSFPLALADKRSSSSVIVSGRLNSLEDNDNYFYKVRGHRCNSLLLEYIYTFLRFISLYWQNLSHMGPFHQGAGIQDSGTIL